MSIKNITYEDYCNFGDGRRYEILDGVIYAMAPAPNKQHQEISMILANRIFNYLQGKSCSVFAAPFDVRLPLAGDDHQKPRNVVQPDIVVICDKAKLDHAGCLGAPDLIIEILSPSTASMDMILKKELYEKAGVPEYWVVDPFMNRVFVFILSGQSYGSAFCLAGDETLASSVLSGLTINLSEIFTEM